MPNLTDMVPVSSIPNLNANLSSATVDTMIAVMGAPREPLVTTTAATTKPAPRSSVW